jgi:hypothetical protein
MIIFLSTRINDPFPELLSALIPGYSLPTYAIPLVLSLVILSILLFYASTSILLEQEIDPDDDLAGCCRQIFLHCLSAYSYTLLNFTLSITRFVPQLLAILRTKAGEGLSIISLGLQIPMLILLAVSVGRRFSKDFRREWTPSPGAEEPSG